MPKHRSPERRPERFAMPLVFSDSPVRSQGEPPGPLPRPRLSILSRLAEDLGPAVPLARRGFLSAQSIRNDARSRLFHNRRHAKTRCQETGYDKGHHADDQSPPQLGIHLEGLLRCLSPTSEG